jgi:hypothetical protein
VSVIKVLVEVEGGCVSGVYADGVPARDVIQIGIVDWDNMRNRQDEDGNVEGGAYWSYPDGSIPTKLEKMVWGL